MKGTDVISFKDQTRLVILCDCGYKFSVPIEVEKAICHRCYRKESMDKLKWKYIESDLPEGDRTLEGGRG